jgi:hypothetical protein
MRFSRGYLLAAAAVVIAASSSDNSGPSTGNACGVGPVGAVTVGNTHFHSAHKGTRNPAVDTASAGIPMTWTWTNTRSAPPTIRCKGHDQQSRPDPLRLDVRRDGYDAGIYEYDRAVHGDAIRGTIVVQ